MQGLEDEDDPRIRMSDVAEVAGVSLKSVSRVINREANVSERLRAKVDAAIKTLGYVPDMAARSLAGGRTFTVGILFDNPSPHYTMNIQAGAYDGCREAGYHLRIDNIDTSASDESLAEQIGAVLRHSRTDGFVLTPPLTDDPRVLDLFDRREIPYVRIAPVLEPGRSPSVEIDDTQAAQMVADYFVDLGHTRFGFVAGLADHGRAQHRREGFIRRLQERLGEVQVDECGGRFSFAGGMEAGEQVLRQNGSPLAIFAANDDMAAGVLSSAARLGYKVPGEVSVCGFDDSWIAMSVSPALTTIHQPMREMARTAVGMLLDYKNCQGECRRLDSFLVERESAGPPAPAS